MTQECPDCGSHFTTYEQPGDTVAGYTTPVIEVDVPGELEVMGIRMETLVDTVSELNLEAAIASRVSQDDGWAVRQIVAYTSTYYNGAGEPRFVVVYERPEDWDVDPYRKWGDGA